MSQKIFFVCHLNLAVRKQKGICRQGLGAHRIHVHTELSGEFIQLTHRNRLYSAAPSRPRPCLADLNIPLLRVEVPGHGESDRGAAGSPDPTSIAAAGALANETHHT